MKPVTVTALAAVLIFSSLHSPLHAEDATLSPKQLRDMHTFKNGPQSTQAVALTFDDGPHPKLTLNLLSLLKENGANATFFMLGKNVAEYPAMAKKVADEGFEIGNHSWSHTDFKKLSDDQIRDELRKTQNAIKEATGQTPKYFRPPYGNINDRIFTIVHEMGLEVVLWSVDPRDWESKGNSPERVKQRIVEGGTGGAIICVHDIHSRTIEAMPDTIAALQANGMKLVTAGEIIEAERIERSKPKPESGGTEISSEPLPPKEPVKIPLNQSGPSRLKDL